MCDSSINTWLANWFINLQLCLVNVFLLFVSSEITKVDSFLNDGYYTVVLRANQAKALHVCYKIKRQEAFFKLSLHCVRKDKKQPKPTNCRPLRSRRRTFKAERGVREYRFSGG